MFFRRKAEWASTTSTTKPNDERISALAALDEPLRRRVYRYVTAQGSPVGRDEAAAAGRSAWPARSPPSTSTSWPRWGCSTWSTAAPPVGQVRERAGRPSSTAEHRERCRSASPSDTTTSSAACWRTPSSWRPTSPSTRPKQHGPRPASTAGCSVEAWLRAQPSMRRPASMAWPGPYGARATSPRSTITRSSSRTAPSTPSPRSNAILVCGMNLELVEGLIEGMELPRVEARLDPVPGRCCVRVDERTRRGRRPA